MLPNIAKTPGFSPLTPEKRGALDTSAQNRTKAPAGDSESSKKDGESTLSKRARRKAQTAQITESLLEVEGGNSVLGKYYSRSFGCSHTLHEKDGKRTAMYCNCRHCLVCNAIRTAKLIDAYYPQLEKMEDPQFVTLTVPNVYNERDLKASLKEMKSVFSKIADRFRKRENRGEGRRISGVRREEVTYGKKGFNQHIHLIIEGEDHAREIIQDWLKHFPEASEAAQDRRQADEGSLKELFKYSAKATETETQDLDPVRLNSVLRVLYGKRTIEAYGSLRKVEVSEDVEELQAEEDSSIPDNTERVYCWNSVHADWFCIDTGESLLSIDSLRRGSDSPPCNAA